MVLAATAVPAQSSASAGQSAAVSPERDVAVQIRSKTVVQSSAGLARVEFTGETLDEVAATDLGWRSMRGQDLIDCTRRMNRVELLQVYAEHQRRGELRTLTPIATWLRPAPRGYMSDVIRSVCGPEKSSPPPIEPPTNSRPSPAVRGPTALSTRQPQTSPHALQPARSSRVSSGPTAPDEIGSSPSSLALATPATTGVASAASINPAEVKDPRAKIHLERSAASVQIAAAGSATEAQGALARLQGRFQDAGALEHRVERAVVRGRVVFRAQFAGFGSYAEAAQFCDRLKQIGQACLVKGAGRAAE